MKQYVNDANYIIRTGTFVPELNAYIQIPVGIGPAKAPIVGIDRYSGNITTFHIKYLKEILSKAPSLGWEIIEPKIDLIGTNQHRGYKSPYKKGPNL